jgi:hypothetical protein
VFQALERVGRQWFNPLDPLESRQVIMAQGFEIVSTIFACLIELRNPSKYLPAGMHSNLKKLFGMG